MNEPGSGAPMKIYDCHYHPEFYRNRIGVAVRTADHDLAADLAAVNRAMAAHGIAGGNLIYNDEQLLGNPALVATMARLAAAPAARDLDLTAMIDVYAPDAVAQVERAAAAHFAALKIHPYIQTIEPESYPKLEAIARTAERLGLVIIIDCSYGTTKMYRCNGIAVAIHLCERIASPIVLAHSGGKRVLDAFSLAREKSNIYMDLAYTLAFWRGSSVEIDFAYAIKHLGADRWLYGSDSPYIEPEVACSTMMAFFTTHGFSERDIEKMMYDNAITLFGGR